MSQLLRVARYRIRATFATRWGGYLSVVVLVAIVGGLSMGAVAGARRTDSSFPVFYASTNPSTVQVFAGFADPALGSFHGYSSRVIDALGELPYLKHAVTTIGFDGSIDLTSLKGTHLHLGAGETLPPSSGASTVSI